MFSIGPNNPCQGTAPPAGSRNRRAQGLRQSPPPTAGASNNPLGGWVLGRALFGNTGGARGGAGRQHQQQQRESDRDHTSQQQRPQERGTIVELSVEQRAEINEVVSAHGASGLAHQIIWLEIRSWFHDATVSPL
ncbi:hypothetical protein L873DRAFT_365858 [Choiromyces venosus 120613-1]|uniref:Uncharacterized protein n=1 Tax=Choiromyces venosus 120613-1 TaxID=1336337 RepID=A0A3N4JWQ0_9PEZI|nr:hypothetical protein L873DRAFT_365858 [Choiromyces venosus 120613-1]